MLMAFGLFFLTYQLILDTDTYQKIPFLKLADTNELLFWGRINPVVFSLFIEIFFCKW